MDRELNRSVRLLEDALSPHGKSLLRTGTPKRFEQSMQKSYDYDQKSLKYTDFSILPNEITLMRENNYSIVDNTLGNILHDKSVSVINKTTKPWESAIDSLFMEFLEVIQARTNIPEVFETVSDLARCCTDTLNVIKSLKSKTNVKNNDDEFWLVHERNTWRLIYCLYQDRLNANQDNNLLTYFGVSEKMCIENLYKRDSLTRETQLVIDWLECNATDDEDNMPKVEYFSDKTVGWENTLHQLQSAETIVFKSTRPIVTEMDPDAPLRQNLPLHDLDIEDEERLCKNIFIYIRCGKLDEAQNLCMHCGHPWRAAMLEGWRLHNDPNAKNNENTNELVKEEIEGNENRDIWKYSAWKYCQENKINIYERATMATFCGYLEVILPVCKTWEDQLWAYLKTVIDIRVESEIRDYVSRTYHPLPSEYWNNKMSLDEVFEKLSSSTVTNIREEAKLPDHVIQKHLILDQIPQLMECINQWLDRKNITPHFVRFLAHLVMFLKQIGQSHRDDIADRVLELYVKILMEMNEPQLVAYYVATLGQQQQLQLYSSFLENITDNVERQTALQFGDDAGLDIKSITKRVVENILNNPEENVTMNTLQRNITTQDSIKISALDWVLFYPRQRTEALNQSNNLISYFLTLGKLDAAKLAFGKIPADTIDHILSGEEEEIPEYVHKYIREHLSYKAYLDAHEAFNDWFKYFHHSKPVAPQTLTENAIFTEKVAHEHRMSQYQVECDRWKVTASHLAKTAKTVLYNVLLFPDGGWLTGADNAHHLRANCVPEMVLLLFNILSESGNYTECIQLADILASEKYSLYKVYSKNKLEDILEKFFETSIKLLDEKKDMWSSD